MIILKEKKSNIFLRKNLKKISEREKKELEELINEYENSLNCEYIECPICHSDKLIRYGTYERNIGVGIIFKRIKIKRVYCKNCGRTHALIPNFIKPYFQYESSFIDFIMLLVYVRKTKMKKIEDKLNLSRQLLRKWKTRFEEHIVRLKTTFCSEDLRYMFKGMLNDKFINMYYNQNGLYYFQKVPT